MSFNVAIIQGFLGKDVEVRSTSGGTKVVSFSVGSSVGWGDKKTTLWDTVICWGDKADFAEKHLKKGSSVRIVGERSSRSYEKDGQTKYTTEIKALDIQFADSGGGGRESRPTTQTRQPQVPKTRAVAPKPDYDPLDDGTYITDEDIPF